MKSARKPLGQLNVLTLVDIKYESLKHNKQMKDKKEQCVDGSSNNVRKLKLQLTDEEQGNTHPIQNPTY